jgi:protein tyrosine/serine phosphatase
MMRRSRSKLWMIRAIAPVSFLLAFGAYLALINISGNFHPVVAGELYRSAQPTPARIAAYKSKYGIATIVNLRGENGRHAWYRDEIAASRRLGIAHVDFRMSAKHELSRERAAELLSILKTARKPILIHCHSGSDRSGLAAAVYLAATGHGEDAAEAQLSWRFGHLGIPLLSSTYSMDTTFEHLEPWLGFPHS